MRRTALGVRVLTTLTAAVVLAAVAVGLALASDHEHRDEAGPRLDTASGLLVSDRSALRMCVQGMSDADGQGVTRSAVMAGLQQAMRHPDWRGAYGPSQVNASVVLDFACPAPRLPVRYEPRTTVAGPGLTATPSPYRVWIYVLDEPAADRILGIGETTAVAPAELMRESTTVFPVSTALIIRASALGDANTTTGGLLAALGLDPARR
ncbi:hypothetical protein [Catellatospora vulcania]|uniref:hypothetical protein n=1 Tax=Catellatospora vulcania TaxID=1460450 RepID=UPI0012D4083F|nr:hypothetical protein [Catellatospora vulcania]